MCPAQDANAVGDGSRSGQQSPQIVHAPSLLVVSSERPLSEKQNELLLQQIQPVADAMGLTALVLEGGMKAEVYRDLSPLVAAIHAQTEAISKLVEQNASILLALTQFSEEEEPQVYLNGRPRQ